ncbi:META domain-containing protein [Streptomyces humidus]|uniref:META domain-containing protein n=1 Tax=Streptomyces humidus TaxID=52259 RepID=UPI003330CE85
MRFLALHGRLDSCEGTGRAIVIVRIVAFTSQGVPHSIERRALRVEPDEGVFFTPAVWRAPTPGRVRLQCLPEAVRRSDPRPGRPAPASRERFTYLGRPRGMNKQRLTFTSLILLPLVVSCGSEMGSVSVGSGLSTDSVTGVRWAVDSLTVDGKQTAAPKGASLEIGKNGKVHGSTGCNNFRATAKMTGGSITFEGAGFTEMACDDVPLAFEDSLHSTLTGGRLEARIKGGGLTLTSDSGDKVQLSEEKPAQLYGIKWTVDALVDDNTARALPPGADGKVWFTLDKKSSRFTGSLGCNRVTAQATVRDGHITLGPLGTTRRMCSGALMETERAMQDLLQKKIAYEGDHRGITLTGDNGQGISATPGN